MSQNDCRVATEPVPAQPLPRLGRAFIQNPHATYSQLRASGPACRVVMWGGHHVWLITRYAEAKAALVDPRLSKNWRAVMELYPAGKDSPHQSVLYSHMLLQDPPDHTRLRKLVTKAFTVRSVQRMRPTIGRIADELLEPIAATAAAHGVVDLMESYALQLPLRVISELLGVPPEVRSAFRRHVEPLLTTANPDELSAAEEALAELLARLIDAKRQVPTDDLLGALVRTSVADDELSPDELVSTAFLLILAGYETTVNLIGNGVLALLCNPAQLAAVRANSALLPQAVEEFLRIESPLNMATQRFTTEAVKVGDVEIPAGQPVLVALLSANHDDRQFDDPDRLDVTRTPNPHLAFGYGIHHCLGAPLARLEGEIAIGRLLARFKRISLCDNFSPDYRSSTLMRGLAALPVRLSVT
ncbi:cytochrome P450 [Mycobacterium kubicae]|uniref:cytochrome P450 family protein n=1 Tax=Mycobacterium kubicae TaxID=120959 RepID=UPI001640FC92|nr:cytochrome P450 [Mycobacterium kubicae]QNI05947.1 cytochrome P450 [Mycobacterium kubicae]